ncbi:sister chromatid cohesion protein PDS5 [Candidatus Neptunichlamydia sp. REUL1]|uniref:sister chromatid cohesion protein PDS5 n=1 Tax=Candidatus Neptunichlamydia sp. REUL1 TaxID=3064277 RepID=UPI00293180C3|nr:sister chromatid cohesion protein PDS5 [Candidatus Neptunochlamydia sp. REUL1]
MSFINPYPITKKGIQDHNPEINAIYTGKTGKSPHFYSVGPKTSGSAMGAIFQKRHFDPSKAAPCKKWMGKANTPIHRNNLPRPTGERLLSEGEVKRYQEAMNISAIYEKIAYDCFYEMGRGIFRVPKTRLSREKFSTPHMREHFLAHVLSDSGIQESLFIMSQIDENYQDFSQAQVEKGLTFIQYLEKYHCPPDHLLTPQGKKVPIKGFMGVLGVGRVLADTDTLGSSGTNAGFQWVYQNGAITYAQTVKIDPGESFSFSLYDHEEALTKNRVLTTLDRPTLEGSPASDLKDIRDLQYGNMISGEKAIQWSTLEENQKDEFLSVLFNASRYLNEDKILQFLLERDEKFNRSPLEQIPKKLTTSIKTKMQSWIRLQLNIYKEDLNLFKSRHPEKILKAYYIDSLGELPLPASQETFPIEELFTQLTLINTESQKGENQPLRKDLPEQDSLTEAFKRGKITSEPINLEDLFIPKEGKPCNKVLMIGGAGIGKSTVCQKIAYDWAAGRLWNTQFKYIYWLPLRYLNPLVKEGKLNRKDPDEWLAQAASHLILKDPALYLSMLREIKAHKHQMLILFDGYDEATPALAQALSPFETSTDLKILFTSRPGPITSLQEKMDRLVENIGFSDPQIHSYMNHYFARKLEIHDPIKAKEALKASLPPSFDLAKEIDNVSLFLISEDQDLRKEALYILGTLGAYAAALNEQDLKNHIVEMLQHKKEKEATLSLNHIARYETDYSPPQRHINPNDLLEIFNKDPNLQAISHTPLQLQMLCALWEQGARECSFPKNLTGLYTTMLTHLFHWNQKEQQKIQYHSLHPEDKHQAFLTLGKAALIGLQEGNLMVSHETLTKSFSADEIQALLTTRLLQGVKKQDAAAYVDYAFLHLTFQEYLAAYFMSCQTRETQKDWIVKHRYFPQFQLVMAFLGGLIHAKDNSDKTRTKAFIEDLHAPPIELIGIAQMHVTLRVLEECRDETLQSWAEERFHIYQAYGDYVLFNIEKLNEAQVTFQFPSFIWPSFMGKINALLKGSDRRVRSSACEALVKLGEKGDKEQFSKILEALRPRLKDSNKRVRRSACDVLVKLGEKGDKEQFSKILEALRPRLKDSNKRVRSSACDVLVKLGEKGDKEQFSKLLKALLPLLQDAYFYIFLRF